MGEGYRSSKRQKDRREVGFLYRRKFRALTRCIYCGNTAHTLDHVLPLSVAAAKDLSHPAAQRAVKFGLRLVPSCLECNLLAGARPFYSILEKRKYIQKRLAKKYRRWLRHIVWTDDEMQEMGRCLRDQVAQAMQNRKVIEMRVNWPLLR